MEWLLDGRGLCDCVKKKKGAELAPIPLLNKPIFLLCVFKPDFCVTSFKLFDCHSSDVAYDTIVKFFEPCPCPVYKSKIISGARSTYSLLLRHLLDVRD